MTKANLNNTIAPENIPFVQPQAHPGETDIEFEVGIRMPCV